MAWTLSDDEVSQYVLKLSELKYRLIQICRYNPEKNSFIALSDIISLDDYFDINGNADDELLFILHTFGYESVEQIRNSYGATANQIMCECIFEHIASQYTGTILFTGSKQECAKFISGYVSTT